jgi:peptide/nickel transport system permease protein
LVAWPLSLREHTMVEGAQALSFLGAGTPPNIPSWGNVMAAGRVYVQRAIWIILFPGAFLATTVHAVNLVGDGLRDLLKVK